MSVRRVKAVARPAFPRRFAIVILTALAAAALSPLPTALLGRLSPDGGYQPDSASAQANSFLETFSGAPASPQRFQSPNWDITLTGNRTGGALIAPMQAHHGPGCEPPLVNANIPFHFAANPLVTHSISTNDQTVFLCRDHVMTAANTGGYAAIYLTPNRMADFSQGESVIRFDMSTLRTSARDWVDFVIMPFDDNQQLNFQDASFPANAIHIEMFNNVGNTLFRGSVIHEFQRSSLPARGTSYDSFLTPDPARRDTFEIRLSRNHIRFGMPAHNMWWIDTDLSPALTWSQGVVQLNQRAYNPDKDESCPGGCDPNTWHWDNVSISPAAPFALIRANQDEADSGSPRLTFPQASPANAHLRFTGQSSTRSGQNLQFSTNGGQSWQDAQLQRDGARIGDEWFKSYWTPIPAGVSNVQFRRADDSNSWRVRDVSFWAQGTAVSIPPAATAISAPTTSAPAASATPTNVSSPPPGPPSPPGSGSMGPGTRVAWQGGSWFLHGVNVPWLNWGCDFGCGSNGGVSSASSRAALNEAFSELAATGSHTARWWMFEGDPWQITQDVDGAPAGIDGSVWADIDAALQLANTHDLYYDFVLFSSPSHLPRSWVTDPVHRSRLASTLRQLFARYHGNPRILSWEVFNEPEYDIWNGNVPQSAVQATVRAIVDAVHASSSAYVTVGSAMLDGLPLWVGLGLDYYQAHWYPSMSGGNWCATCTDYAALRARYSLNAPLVIGELYAGPDASAAALLEELYDSGYAGAWAWSLFPDRTGDRLAVDMNALASFARQHEDLGPRTGLARPVPAGTSTPVTSPGAGSPTSVPGAPVALPPGQLPSPAPGQMAITPTTVPATGKLPPGKAPAPVAESGWSQLVAFNDLGSPRELSWRYPAGIIDWGTSNWLLSGPYGKLTTKNVTFNGSSRTSASFTFVHPKRLASVQLFNGGSGPSTVSLSCTGQPAKSTTLRGGELATIELGWAGTCSTVTFTSSNGASTHMDNLMVYDR